MIRTLVTLVVASCFLAAAPAQFKDKVTDKADDKKPTTKTDDKGPAKGSPVTKITLTPAIPGEVDIFLLNGSAVRMILQSQAIDIATPFGQLTVPKDQIRSIEFGLHYPDGVEARIQAAIKNLGGENFRDRDQAGKTLIELGPYSYPAVLEASNAKDLETSRRGKDLVKQLQAKHPKKDLKTAIEDRVVTPAFTIVGRILNPTIKANAELFGQVDFPVARIRAMRSISGGQDIELTLDAAKYGNQNTWMETDFVVDGQNAIVVTASGLVDVWPQQGGNYIVGPNGLQGRNMGMPFNAAAMRGGAKLRGPLNGQIYGGALLGKIGEDGEMFMIGERYEGTPETVGKLFLHIGPSPWNQQSSGTYEVKIARKN